MKKNRLCGYPARVGWAKLLRVMKLTAFLVLLLVFDVSASLYSQNSKVSVKVENGTLSEIFSKIEEGSEYRFFYQNEQIRDVGKKSIEVTNEKISDLVAGLLEETGLSYRLVDRNIIIFPKSEDEGYFKNVAQQSISVSGRVTDSSGQPLPGVTVVVKGTTRGTVTDGDGNYSTTNVPGDATLVFSFVGMKSQEISVAGKTSIDVIMADESIGIEEVVAIGYGTVKRSDLTGSVASVSSEDFGDRGGTGIGGLLQGLVPGVDVTAEKIRIRGVTTINNTDPLFVIDGFIGGNMGTVHPNDIESIEILKDASSTAIYGARGANGVILVTTKKGTGAPKVELNAFYGVATPAKQLEILDAAGYMNLVRDIELNGGTTASKLGTFSKIFNADGTPNTYSTTDRTNWQDEMFNPATTEEVTMSIRGGSSKSSYSVSTAYNNSNSMAGNINWKNYRFAVTGDWWVLKDKVKITENFRVQHWNTTGMDGSFLDFLGGGLRMPPYSPILDENAIGGYAFVTTTDDLNDANNPLAQMNRTDRYNKGINIMAQFAADVHFFEGLTLNSSLGVTGNSNTYNDYNLPYQSGNLVFPDSELTESFGFSYAPKIENYLTYTNTFGIHNITAMIGNTYEKGAYGRSVQVFGKGFISDNVRNVTAAKERSITSNAGSHYSYLSYFGRINYVLANKYLLTVNMRADGSDKFALANRWGYFPSVAVGWKINEENFMKDVDKISQLKLRASYGITGNDAIGQYQYFSRVHSNSTYAFPSHGFGGVNLNGATIISLASPVIRWEETKNLSVGVDLGLFNNKLEINADYFHKDTYDILFAVPQPPSLGMGFTAGGGNAIVNAASVLNKGFELNIIHKNTVGDWSYNIQANVTIVNNEVTSLGNGEPYNAGRLGFYSTNRTELGHSIGYFYGFKMDKVYAKQAEVDADNAAARAAAQAADPTLTADDLANIYYQSAETRAGDIRFIDLPDEDGNYDGKITDDDRTDLGSPIPKLNYGLTATVKYKNFDAFMAWTGIAGNKILYEFGYWMEGMIRPFNATTVVEDRWRSESDPGNGTVPRAVKTDPAKNLRMSDRFIYSGAYARMRQLSVGYTLPAELIQNSFKGAIDNVRFYLSGDNLITFTKYPGYNPEIGGSNTERGSDGGVYPAPRTFRIGVNVSF